MSRILHLAVACALLASPALHGQSQDFDDLYRDAFIQAGLEVVDTSQDLFGYGLYVCRRRDMEAM